MILSTPIRLFSRALLLSTVVTLSAVCQGPTAPPCVPDQAAPSAGKGSSNQGQTGTADQNRNASNQPCSTSGKEPSAGEKFPFPGNSAPKEDVGGKDVTAPP